MKVCRVDVVGSAARLELGVELVDGLRRFYRTRGLAPEVVRLGEVLACAREARLVAKERVQATKAELRAIRRRTEVLVRAIGDAAEVHDGAERGPLHAELFPRGLSAVVRGNARRQVERTHALLDRLEALARAAAPREAGLREVGFRETWSARLALVSRALGGALRAHVAARVAHAAARAVEGKARDAHRRGVDRTQARVRAAFPRNPHRRSRVFPEAGRRGRRDRGRRGFDVDDEDDGDGDGRWRA